MEWNIHLSGDVEIMDVASITRNSFVMIANYRGDISSNLPDFDVPSSSGNHEVYSGLVMLFLRDDIESDFHLQWYTSILTPYYSSDVYLHQIEVLDSFLVVSGATSTSALMFSSGDNVDELSTVVGSIGNFYATIDITEGI